MKEIDTLYDVRNFEATCFFNQREPEDYRAFEIHKVSGYQMGKILGMLEGDQFDAKSRVGDL